MTQTQEPAPRPTLDAHAHDYALNALSNAVDLLGNFETVKGGPVHVSWRFPTTRGHLSVAAFATGSVPVWSWWRHEPIAGGVRVTGRGVIDAGANPWTFPVPELAAAIEALID